MSRVSILLVLLAGCSTAMASGASATDIPIRESRDDSAITEGETILQVDPDTAYRAVTDYPRWRSIFPGIREVLVTEQRGVQARVTLVHAEGNRDNLHFHNAPAARMVWFEDTGGRATVWAEIIFLPGQVPGTTRVHSRLYVDVRGIASLVVSDRKLRSIREQRIRSDLTHLRAYFNKLASER
jgi:carbon monoxide dehydrogenase subunit G